MLLQPDTEHEPYTRAEVRIYLGDELVATTMRRVDAWPECKHCGEEIVVLHEVHAGPDGLHHDGCTPPRRKK
jgi:hypothetical protein